MTGGDVLLAMRMGKQSLVMTIQPGRGRMSWRLEPSNMDVPSRIAESVRQDPAVQLTSKSATRIEYHWEGAAA